MLNTLKPLFLVACLFLISPLFSQTGHEAGIFTGPVQMRSDFGLRGDTDTNLGNIGFGIGVFYALNPMDWGSGYRRNGSKLFDHFKIRLDAAYNKTNLKHYGKYVEPDQVSENADKLRAQSGVTQNIDFGFNFEVYPFSLKNFYYRFFSFSPYFLLGTHATYANPGASTTYGDQDITNPDNFYGPWAPGSIDTTSFYTFSVVTGAGVRYKVSDYSDFLFEVKWQFFNSDWVDGLNHQLDYNKHNDSMIWLNFGYVYYIN